MKLVILACFLVGCSLAKIAPVFVPGDIAKHAVDVARDIFVKEKRAEAQALKAEQNKGKGMEIIAEGLSQATEEPPVTGD